MEPAKDPSEIIPSASLKFCGAAGIKFTVALRIKKYIVLIAKEISSDNLKSTATGSIQCHYQLNTFSKEDATNLENSLKIRLPKRKKLSNFTTKLSKPTDKD